jgi:predicted permease
MQSLFRRLNYLLNRRRLDAELADEMEFHREMAARDGHAPFGNPLRLREEAREVWGAVWMDRLTQDLRFALRLLRRSPGFTLAAVLMLAFGIGINVAAFSFFNLIVFRPLPLRDPQSLVRFHRAAPGNYSSDLSYQALQFYREHAKTISTFMALDAGPVLLEGAADPLKADFVSANFFQELGAAPAAGRLFDARLQDDPAIPAVAVLSHAFWQRHFGGDSSVVGQTLRLNGKPVVVAGVATPTFAGFSYTGPDIWLPLIHQPYFVEGSRLLTNFSPDADGVDVWGRLRPGIGAKAATHELRGLTAELRKLHPNDFWENESLIVDPGGYAQKSGGRDRGNRQPPNVQQQLYPVFALVGALALLILAVSCANLGSLLLARGAARQREIAVRTAVGAGSGRLIRQLLTESLVLSLLGSAAGLLLGSSMLRLMLAYTGGPTWIDASPDWRVVAFTVAAGLTAALLFGLAPALQVARPKSRNNRARTLLIGAQVAASCVLLIVAGLLVRALHHAASGNPGFEYKQVIAIDPRLALHGFADSPAHAYLDLLQSRLRAIPGVESVSLAASAPLGNKKTTLGAEKNGKSFEIVLNHVDPDFFPTMRIALLRGRVFARGEQNCAIVSDSLARSLWPGEDPLTHRLEFDGTSVPIIGVTANARVLALADSDSAEAYFPAGPGGYPGMTVLVKSRGPVEPLLASVTTIARDADTRVVPAVQTLQRAYARKLETTEQSVLTAGVLGAVALLLACLGITGVVTFAVSQRVREIGVRMALGASPAHVLRIVLSRLSLPVALGLLAGVLIAAALSQVLRRELYGISNLDPVAYLASVLLFLATAAVAAILPARRALKIDPMRALRHD